MRLFVFYLFCASFMQTNAATTKPCRERFLGNGKAVCVCNEDHCDSLSDITTPEEGAFVVVSSSRDGERFSVREGVETSAQSEGDFVAFSIDYSSSLQEIYGFGGSFTDAAGINIKSLSPKLQEILMKSYFSQEGLNYNLGRVPIGGSDFSTHPYSYDDVEDDVSLTHFSLAEEDFKYKIPLIMEAQSIMSPAELLLIASPWSPPAWMKTNGQFNGTGGLKEEHYEAYAKYIVKFLRSYEKQKITVWAITTQNEPVAGLEGLYENWAFNSCGWKAEKMRDWIKDHLGPRFKKENVNTLLLIYDSNRDLLESFTDTVLQDPKAKNYVDGIGLHWYMRKEYGPEAYQRVHEKYPDKFMLATESCLGYETDDESVILGSWERAEEYAFYIIESCNNQVVGWIDWNLALDMEGGPNWANNFVDAPILVNKEANEFYKQPMFYALGHFSKFIPRGSVNLKSQISDKDVFAAVFRTPKKDIVVVLQNKSEEKKQVRISTGRETHIELRVAGRSILTLMFKEGRQMTSGREEL